MGELARAAYEAYAKSTDWKNFQGNPMPTWDDLPESIRVAWRAATDMIASVVGPRANVAAEQPIVDVPLNFTDLTHVRVMVGDMVARLNAGPKSRWRSLVVTKLEEASMWANEGLRQE